MMHTTQALYDQLTRVSYELEQLLVEKRKEQTEVIDMATAEGKEPITIYELVDGYGNSPLASLLVAKAQCLAAMANLKVASGAKR